ncbi:MAG: hypothetical protein AAGM38_01000 [Pseudomonadota bacterium]
MSFVLVTLEATTAIAAAPHMNAVVGACFWRAATLSDLEHATGPDVSAGEIVLLAVEETEEATLLRYEAATRELLARAARVLLVLDVRAPEAEARLLALGAETALLWPFSDGALAEALSPGWSGSAPAAPGAERGAPAERLARPPDAQPDQWAVSAPTSADPFAEAYRVEPTAPPPGSRPIDDREPTLAPPPPRQSRPARRANRLDASLSNSMAAIAAVKENKRERTPSAGAVISVFRSAGGAGATTVAVNLACDLAEQVQPNDALTGEGGVALLDLDLQSGGSTSHLEMARSDVIEELLLSERALSLEEALGAMVRRKSLAVLPAPASTMPLDAAQAARVEELIALLSGHFAFIVIDTPIALTVWSEPVLRRSSRVLLTARALSVNEASASARFLATLRGEDVKSAPVELVLNGAPAGLDWTRKARIKKFETVAAQPFRHQLAEGGAAAQDAADAGMPLGEIERRNPLRLSIQKLASEMAAERETALIERRALR